MKRRTTPHPPIIFADHHAVFSRVKTIFPQKRPHSYCPLRSRNIPGVPHHTWLVPVGEESVFNPQTIIQFSLSSGFHFQVYQKAKKTSSSGKNHLALIPPHCHRPRQIEDRLALYRQCFLDAKLLLSSKIDITYREQTLIFASLAPIHP